ncbi:MAG: ATP synthase F1 subunit gamma [Bacteroidales bacterium]
MPNLKEVRTRIASVKSTQQITSAMKMVAAAKLRKAQNAILQMRPYAAKLHELLQNLSSALDSGDDSSVYAQQREPGKVLIVAISSNRGLCGAFNSNVIKKVNALLKEEYSSQYSSGSLHLMTVGKKVNDSFRRRKVNIVADHQRIFDRLSFENASAIAEDLMSRFRSGEYDRIVLVYNQFKNAASQNLVAEQFLPVEPPAADQNTGQSVDYIFEPNRHEIVLDLIPKSLKVQFYKALLDSFAAEHGARMTAMHQATENAKELLHELSLTYNKARQASITKELLEIVSGAEALKG